jgi:hypothetical protein
MSTRISETLGLAGALLLLLAGCGGSPPGEGTGNVAAPAQSPIEAVKSWVDGVADKRPRIFCAVGAAAPLAQDCRIETVEDLQSRILILSRPDGGFRRVRVSADGALVAADGAVGARTARHGSAIAVLFGEERYAVPITALGSAPTP